MINKRTVVPLLGMFIVAAFYMLASANRPGYEERREREAQGAGDDDAGREEYEFMRLRDPATGKIPDNIRAKELAYGSNLPNDFDKMLASYASGRTTALAWQPRGPWNVGGRTRALGVDVTNERNLIAGTVSGTMWRSTDAGVTWVPTTPSMQYKSVTAVAQDTRHAHTNVWYYSTGEGFGASASATGAYYLGDGIYKSVDSGVTWSVLPSTLTANLTTFDTWSDIVWNIATYPADTVNDVVFAAVYGGIYKSMDGGSTWTFILGSGNSYFTDIAVTKTGVVYVTMSSDGLQHGIFRSTDGTTFTNITPTGWPATFNRIKIGINPTDESQVYLLANTPGSGTIDTNYLGNLEYNSLWKYKYLSGDGSGSGGLWNDYSSNLPNSGGFFDRFTSQGSYNLVVRVKPDDSNTVFVGGSGLYRSTSGFADNTHTTIIGGYLPGATLPVVGLYANHHPDQHELIFLQSDPAKMYSSNDGGIFFTNNDTAATVAWTPRNNGYLTTMFYSCAIDHATTSDIIIGGAQDNGSWYTNSASLTAPWVTPRGGDGSFCAIADNATDFYFSLQQGKMWRTKLNASGGVDSSARIDPIGGFGYLFVNPFVIDPNNNNIMYLAAGRCLWRNNNLSGIPLVNNWDSITTNWVKFTDSLPAAGTQITAIAACKTPANRVYYGSSYKRLYRIENANVGTPSRVDITSSLFPGGSNISCVAVDPSNGDNLLVVFSNYGSYSLFYSTDAGATFKKVGGNLEEHPSGGGNGPSIRWATIIPLADGTVYLVGTSVGLFATTHLHTEADSTVWVQQGSTTIGSSVVNMIDYRATDGLVVIATHSAGMFSTHINSIADVSTATPTVNNHFDLDFNNFPNPFTNTTTIRFSLKESSNVTLKVYDGQGRLVKILANGPMNAGEQNFTFEPSILSAGVYYCTLTADGYTETRKLMLLR